VLVELSVMEQRYQAVLAVVQDGWKVVEVARRLGVSRQSVHSWIDRYEKGGLASLAAAMSPEAGTEVSRLGRSARLWGLQGQPSRQSRTRPRRRRRLVRWTAPPSPDSSSGRSPKELPSADRTSRSLPDQHPDRRTLRPRRTWVRRLRGDKNCRRRPDYP